MKRKSLIKRQYRVIRAGGEFYKLLERRKKRAKNGSIWKAIAIGTRRLYAVADVLNGAFRP